MTKQQIFIFYLNADMRWVYSQNWERKELISSWHSSCGGRKLTISNSMYQTEVSDYTDVKLILRPFEDMTKNELKEYDSYFEYIKFSNFNNETYKQVTFEGYLYLLSIGIDLFGAIKKGYAINAKEI